MPQLFRASFAFALVTLVAAPALAESTFIKQLVPPADGIYDRSLVLRFTATFSSPVNVTGSPRLPLVVGGATRYATWSAPLDGGPLATLAFEYVPQPYDSDRDGIATESRLDLNGGAIAGIDGTPADVSFVAPNTRGIRVELLLPPAPRILRAEFREAVGAGEPDILVLSGSADGNSVVTLQRGGTGVIGQAIAVDNGAWSIAYALTDPAMALHFTATAMDRNGLESPPSDPMNVVVVDRSSAVREKEGVVVNAPSVVGTSANILD
jgi:hypothetical protein